jgi:Carboxypeptidase regulatory-like domain
MRKLSTLACPFWLLLLTGVGWPQAAPQVPRHEVKGTAVDENAGPHGGVKGSVVDESGNPVEGARVYSFTDGAYGAALYVVSTDDQGRFYLPRIPAGREHIHADKEASGFIDDGWEAFGPFDYTIVNVVPGQVLSGVVVRLKKGGVLGGVVINCQTGRSMDARLILTRVDDPKLVGRRSPDRFGSLKIVLPPRPFKLKAVADGYVDWQYPAPSSPESGFIIPVGQRKTLVIAMQPVGGHCK